jgi:hypothetical protein
VEKRNIFLPTFLCVWADRPIVLDVTQYALDNFLLIEIERFGKIDLQKLLTITANLSKGKDAKLQGLLDVMSNGSQLPNEYAFFVFYWTKTHQNLELEVNKMIKVASFCLVSKYY